jgi:hypothetical protein
MKTKYEKDWTCDCCGELQSKHNQYFDGVCEVCVVNTLTAEEEEYLEKLRVFLKKDNGLDKISGGFCTITPQYFDEDEIHCLVKLGTSDDTGNYNNEFIIEVDRKKLDFDFIY